MTTGDVIDLVDATRGDLVSPAVTRLVIAGYTGRDRGAVQRHIDELAQHGIPAPASVPTFYELSPGLLTVSDEITVSSSESSGEAEPVLFCGLGRWYLGVGSDHTARDVERESIAASKASCQKPVSRSVVPFDSVVEHWDRLTLRSSSDGRPYQQGSLAELLPPRELVAACERATSQEARGLVLFCGTVPVLSGRFLYGGTFTAELVDGDRTLISCTYRITTMED